MTDTLKEIYIGRGLGNMLFGLNRDQVTAILGKPTDKDTYELSEDDEDESEAWHYDDLDISLSFDEINDWKLSSIAVSSDEYTLEGKPMIGRKKEDVLNDDMVKAWGENEEDEEIREDDPDHCLLHFEDVNLSLWFDKDVLTEMQWGPLMHDDETYAWPTV